MSHWGDVAFVGAMIAAYGLILFSMWAIWYSLTVFGVLNTAIGSMLLGLIIVLGSAAADD